LLDTPEKIYHFFILENNEIAKDYYQFHHQFGRLGYRATKISLKRWEQVKALNTVSGLHGTSYQEKFETIGLKKTKERSERD
jgi:hypothetical protein